MQLSLQVAYRAVFLPDIGGMLGVGFMQANTTRKQEYAQNRSNVQTGTCNFR